MKMTNKTVRENKEIMDEEITLGLSFYHTFKAQPLMLKLLSQVYCTSFILYEFIIQALYYMTCYLRFKQLSTKTI